MVAIRLRRAGSKKRPFFRVVVTDSRAARDSSRSAPTSPAAAARACAGSAWARPSRSRTGASSAVPAGVSCTLRLVVSSFTARPRSDEMVDTRSTASANDVRILARPPRSSASGGFSPSAKGIAEGATACHPPGAPGGICAGPSHGTRVDALRPACAS